MNERTSERAEHNNNIRVTCRWIFGVQFSLALLVAGNAALGIGCSDASRSLLSFSYRFVVRSSSGHGWSRLRKVRVFEFIIKNVLLSQIPLPSGGNYYSSSPSGSSL